MIHESIDTVDNFIIGRISGLNSAYSFDIEMIPVFIDEIE